MSTEHQRRSSERISSMQAYPYALIKHVDGSTVQLTEGSVYSINESSGGMLFLLPEGVGQRQMFEIRVPSESRNEQIAKLGEVCWTRSIPVEASPDMHLVGIRFLFELPAPDRSSNTF